MLVSLLFCLGQKIQQCYLNALSAFASQEWEVKDWVRYVWADVKYILFCSHSWNVFSLKLFSLLKQHSRSWTCSTFLSVFKTDTFLSLKVGRIGNSETTLWLNCIYVCVKLWKSSCIFLINRIRIKAQNHADKLREWITRLLHVI